MSVVRTKVWVWTKVVGVFWVSPRVHTNYGCCLGPKECKGDINEKQYLKFKQRIFGISELPLVCVVCTFTLCVAFDKAETTRGKMLLIIQNNLKLL